MIKALVRVSTGAVEGLDDPATVKGIEKELALGVLVWMDAPAGAGMDELELKNGVIVKNAAKAAKKVDAENQNAIIRDLTRVKDADVKAVLQAIIEKLGLNK